MDFPVLIVTWMALIVAFLIPRLIPYTALAHCCNGRIEPIGFLKLDFMSSITLPECQEATLVLSSTLVPKRPCRRAIIYKGAIHLPTSRRQSLNTDRGKRG